MGYHVCNLLSNCLTTKKGTYLGREEQKGEERDRGRREGTDEEK